MILIVSFKSNPSSNTAATAKSRFETQLHISDADLQHLDSTATTETESETQRQHFDLHPGDEVIESSELDDDVIVTHEDDSGRNSPNDTEESIEELIDGLKGLADAEAQPHTDIDSDARVHSIADGLAADVINSALGDVIGSSGDDVGCSVVYYVTRSAPAAVTSSEEAGTGESGSHLTQVTDERLLRKIAAAGGSSAAGGSLEIARYDASDDEYEYVEIVEEVEVSASESEASVEESRDDALPDSAVPAATDSVAS